MPQTEKLQSPLIVEGPNRSGKTRLTRALFDLYGFKNVVHTGGPKRSPEEMNQACKHYAADYGPDTILDRIPMISQLAYDRALRRVPVVPPDFARAHWGLMKPPVFVVMCLPPVTTLEQGWRNEDAMQSPNRDPDHSNAARSNVHELHDAYVREMLIAQVHYRINFIMYDMSTDSPDFGAQRVMSLLREVGACAD